MNDKVYMILGLSRDDAIELDEQGDWADDGDEHRYQKIYENLSEDDKRYLARYIRDWLWDGDQFYQAVRSGLEDLAAEKLKEAI